MDAYSRHYQSSSYVKFPQERRVAGASNISLLSVMQESHDFSDPAVDDFVIAAARKTDMEFSWNIGDGWTKPARVRDQSLHVIPPNTAASIRANGLQDMLFVIIPRGVEERFLQPIGKTLNDFAAHNTDYFHSPEILKRLDLIWNLGSRHSTADSLRVDAAVLEVMALLADRPDRQSPGTRLRRGGLSPWALKKAKALLEEGIQSPQNLETIADAVGLSSFHFIRAFRESTGLPPHRWQMERRIERARALLTRTMRSVTDIALEVGYESGQALARAFKQQTGLSPLGFREQQMID